MGWIKLRARGRWYGRKASEWTLTICPSDGLPDGVSGSRRRPGEKLRKSILGTLMGSRHALTVSHEYRSCCTGTQMEPSRGIADPSTGTEADRYYYHGVCTPEREHAA